MKHSLCLKGVLLSVFTIAIVFIAAPAVNKAYGQCDPTSADTQIVDSINSAVKSDSSLSKQVSHFRVSSRKSAVKLYGWTDAKRDWERLYDIAMNTKCVRLVNTQMLLEEPPPADSSMRASNGCSTGTKPCGDICIPEADSCDMKQ